MEQRAEALCARAGLDNGDGLVFKHKWMRWRTFNRLMEKADTAGAAADAAFVSRIAGLFAKPAR